MRKLLPLLLALIFGACSDSGDTGSASRCQAFPKEMAETLISNADTGARKIEGEIVETAAVESNEKVFGDSLWFISIKVGATIVTVAHNSPPGAGPTGAGLYASIDAASEAATSFPPNDRLKSALSTDGAAASRDCVS